MNIHWQLFMADLWIPSPAVSRKKENIKLPNKAINISYKKKIYTQMDADIGIMQSYQKRPTSFILWKHLFYTCRLQRSVNSSLLWQPLSHGLRRTVRPNIAHLVIVKPSVKTLINSLNPTYNDCPFLHRLHQHPRTLDCLALKERFWLHLSV